MTYPNLSSDSEQHFRVLHSRLCCRADKFIAIIMSIQWTGAIGAALLVSPRTWERNVSSLHPHLIAAVYFGGLVTILPVTLAAFRPGERFTRHVIAACQMLMSGLLIHISGGRPETHFHIFGSLAFLGLYLDWTVLVTATVTTVLNHSLLAYFAPISIFGTAVSPTERFFEHVLWVVFFDSFLIASCIQNLKGLREVARREAEQGVLLQDQQMLLHQAYHDSLTGLGNRLLIHKELDERRSRRGSGSETFALMAIDLDHFKEVNDTLGHQVGDDVLTQVSGRIQAHIRNKDTLVRMGGDEFALIIAECHAVTFAESIAQRIIDSLNLPFQCGIHTVHIGVSIGICVNREAATESEELFRHADLALYRIKNAGRNQFLVFDEEMRAETLRQMSLEHRLRNAVQTEGLRVHYQPIVTTHNSVIGFEALLRWQDSVHGSVSPEVFIPIAERTGLIVPLGSWVLRKACVQAAAWRRTGNDIRKISVNVSSIQLEHPGFVAIVLKILKETGLPAEVLDLELTESALIKNHGAARKALDLLRRFGVRLSIDDFGTGYSSLSYLRDLPVQTLKIDRSFVKDMVTSAGARTLVESMISMAHTLNLRVVAEGVETDAQFDLLALAGCDEIQGFHISRAVDSDGALRLLSESQQSNDVETQATNTSEMRQENITMPIAS
jgi:diguanylate cyclase (GGDEF)-like protein